MAFPSLNEIWPIVLPIAVFVLGVVLYALFVFKFYRFLARRDIVSLDLNQYNKAQYPAFKKFLHSILYVLEYLIIMPLCIFIWFLILAALLSFLAKNQGVDRILLVAMAVVGAVRVVSFYSSDLAKDLAKMLPFALLAVYLADFTYVDFSNSIALLKQLPGLWQETIVYLAFVIVLEILLRIITAGHTPEDDLPKQ